MSIKCRNCGAENEQTVNFCGSCGAQLIFARAAATNGAETICPNCGNRSPSKFNNCPKCGSPLKQQVVFQTRTTSQQETKKKFKWWKLFTWPFICLVSLTESCCSCCCGSCCDTGSSNKSLKQEVAEEVAENVLDSLLGD